MENPRTQNRMGNSRTQKMILSALFIAMIFVATKINIKLPIGNGGLVHLGTAFLFIIAVNFGAKYGTISGAVGMTLFDVLSGWAAWAPTTFLARLVMGYIVGKMNEKRKEGHIIIMLLSFAISGAFMIIIYYIGNAITFGNWVAPIESIPGDITQIVIGTLVALPATKAIERINILKKYRWE